MNHRPFILITAAFVLGILIQQWLKLSFGLVSFIAVILLGISFIYHKKIVFSTAILLMVLMSLGAVYMQARHTLDYNHINSIAKYYRSKPIAVKGVIASSIRKTLIGSREKYSFTFQVEQVQANWGWEEKNVNH